MKNFVLPNYNKCITNLACSIMKYFEIENMNNSLENVDKILRDMKPKNVVVILYDGLGLNILKRALNSDSFLVKNIADEISSVSPSTTTASTTSMLTGLNPKEHGWLGWDLYIKKINKIVTMFLNTEKDSDKVAENYNVCHSFYPYETITKRINDNNKYSSKIVSPFGSDKYKDIDDMNNIILEETKLPGKKYIYAYYQNPDSVMHDYGTDSKEAISTIELINKKTEELCSKLDKDTIVIVTADHGHINSKGILLSDYPDFYETLDGDIWIEPRMTAFKIKQEKKEKFIDLFNKYFKNDFILKTKEEVIKENIFGTGIENSLFRDSLGDFFALAISDKYFRYSKTSVNVVSLHGGFTEDEMIIPLIIIK